MFDDRHTMLPPGTRPETDIHPVDVGKAGDLQDPQSLPRDSTGLLTRRNWYVAAAAGAILVGAGVWSFSAHMAMPDRGTLRRDHFRIEGVGETGPLSLLANDVVECRKRCGPHEGASIVFALRFRRSRAPGAAPAKRTAGRNR